jgi:peptidoglycan hydrolase-like protein with peptidoglycan-binding domain
MENSNQDTPNKNSGSSTALTILIVILLLLCAYLGYRVWDNSNNPPQVVEQEIKQEIKVEPQLGPNQYILLSDVPKPPRVDNNPEETLNVLLAETEKIREVKREIPKIFSELRPYTENNQFIWIVDPKGDQERIDVYKGIQRALKLVGDYGGAIDGDWQATEQAVINFQSKFAIANDGYFGRNTLGKICTIYLDQISKGE